MRILFLYSRLPNYFYKCIQYLVHEYDSSIEVLVVTYQEDPDSPHHIKPVKGIDILFKNEFDQEKLAAFNPDIIYKSGWADEFYNELTKPYLKKIPVVLGFDNFWEGAWRQYVAVLLSKFIIRNKATHVWVPGPLQKEYAKKLGFKENRIINNLYCADLTTYKNQQINPKKNIVFVGRFVEFKRPEWLLKSFSQLLNENQAFNDWTLTMIGNGPLKEALKTKYRSEKINFIDFTDPHKLSEIYKTSSVFCLPSKNEHWGVVVHEAAAAGLALLLSDTCGAAATFLDNQHNGLVFETDNPDSLKKNLRTLMSMDEKILLQWQHHSKLCSERISHRLWCESLMKLVYEK